MNAWNILLRWRTLTRKPSKNMQIFLWTRLQLCWCCRSFHIIEEEKPATTYNFMFSHTIWTKWCSVECQAQTKAYFPFSWLLFTCAIIRHKSHSAQNAQMIWMKLYSCENDFSLGWHFYAKLKYLMKRWSLWIFKYSSGWISKSGIQINKERHRDK